MEHRLADAISVFRLALRVFNDLGLPQFTLRLFPHHYPVVSR